MAEILRVKAKWSGFTGSPGYSVFHFGSFTGGTWTTADAQSASDRVRQFFFDAKSLFPAVVQIDQDAEVEAIDPNTGNLLRTISITKPAQVQGGGVANAAYAAPVGGVVSWKTNGVRNGRKVKGRTFLVPFTGAAFEGNGTLSAGSLLAMQTASTGLSNQTPPASLGIFGRPTTKGGVDGTFFNVTSYSIPDMGAVLRSRRD